MIRAWYVAFACAALLGSGCSGSPESRPGPRPFMSTVDAAVAVVHPMKGSSCRGVVRFTQVGDSVKVVGDFEELAPGSKHALHIHEFGNCVDPDGGSAGGHYVPHAHKDDKPHTEAGHSGNLGDLEADANGKAHFEAAITNCSLAGIERPIIGRCVVVDAKPGAAGAHSHDGAKGAGDPKKHEGIGCGVIGVASTKP